MFQLSFLTGHIIIIAAGNMVHVLINIDLVIFNNKAVHPHFN